MNIETLQHYCLAKPGVEETQPFGPDTLVFKVMGKIFALTGLDEPELRVNLKCDPEWAVDLRENHPDQILPGWHMNKKHWNTVRFEAGLPEELLRKMIDHAYTLVVAGLSAKDKETLRNLG